MSDDPMRFYREGGLRKQVLEEIRLHTSLTTQNWVHALLNTYLPHAEKEDVRQAKKATKQTHHSGWLTPGRAACIRNTVRKHPEWGKKEQVEKVAAELRKVSLLPNPQKSDDILNEEFAAYLTPPLAEDVRKAIIRVLEKARLR